MKTCPKCKQTKELIHFFPTNPYSCKTCIKAYKKEKYQNDPEYLKKANAQVKRYRLTQKYKANRNLSDYNRYYKDIIFRVKHILRTRTRIALKRNVKSHKGFVLLGCTIEELKTYLENKFQTGMNWANLGDWHIDHILPCSSFDLSRAEEQARCFHYSNLQPLWARDNLMKGSRLIYS